MAKQALCLSCDAKFAPSAIRSRVEDDGHVKLECPNGCLLAYIHLRTISDHVVVYNGEEAAARKQ